MQNVYGETSQNQQAVFRNTRTGEIMQFSIKRTLINLFLFKKDERNSSKNDRSISLTNTYI